MRKTTLFTAVLAGLLFCTMSVNGAVKKFSTAGFYELAGSGRMVWSMNPAWRFYKGAVAGGASAVDFDDSKWSGVNLPNGMEVLPLEASGGVNYRGESWYRKSFVAPSELHGRRVVLYFEAVMGKCKVWVNGELVKEHFGGFTPIGIDVSSFLNAGQHNVIAVWADNSDDPIYPPGKPQATLDFCYFGGIYRDVWLVATSTDSYITDANMENKIAGGGFFASYSNVSDKSADVTVKLDIDGLSVKGKIDYELLGVNGEKVTSWSGKLHKGENITRTVIKNPALWSPETPNLYTINIRVKNAKGVTVDGYSQRVGIRTIDFSYRQGFILNGKPYPRKLIGANRHQDFAVVGNAQSNNLHYRDVAKLKAAGMEVIRNAHYPQDPAFMDACDELGLFVIENTPGWQFWNDAPIFEQRVYSDIANIVRRDRNRPSVLLWEPILNETWYPETFAKNTHEIIKVETPYKGTNFTAADDEALGSKYFDVIFTHPKNGGGRGDQNYAVQMPDTTKVYFTREWGDNVDDWNSHNSTSRVARQWGEVPQLVQAIHYAAPKYPYTSYEVLQNQPAYHFGGTLWHSFDHQRGYHPDPFYGGVMDAFRRPKYSYAMFQAQSDHSAPMVFIANELTPFSPSDVTVFSNCHSVRLRTIFGGDSIRMGVKEQGKRWFVFRDAWDHMQDKWLTRQQPSRQRECYILAEGLDKDGRVVATDRREPARRAVRLDVTVDTMCATPVATGGDLVVVTARMVDSWGNVKRLNNEFVRFSVEGEGVIVASEATETNPVGVLWGEASVLVRTTTKAGRICVKAEVIAHGDNTPVGGMVEFSSLNAPMPMVFDSNLTITPCDVVSTSSGAQLSADERSAIDAKLREVEQQQTDFGEKK